MKETEKAYIAGFLDADGSVYVRLKPNITYRYNYQIAPYIVFCQKENQIRVLEKIKNFLKVGYFRYRKDGIVDYIIGDEDSIRKVINVVRDYVILKKKQLKILEKVLDLKKPRMPPKKFLTIVNLIDQFEKLNYSKRRILRKKQIVQELRDKSLL